MTLKMLAVPALISFRAVPDIQLWGLQSLRPGASFWGVGLCRGRLPSDETVGKAGTGTDSVQLGAKNQMN